MLKRLFEKVNKQRGSATVEAVVGFTGFLLLIFTLLSLINLCRAQMLISSAMDNAAKELSQYSYFYEMSGLHKFSEALGEEATVGRSDINDVIGSVDSLYSTVVKTVGDGKESYTNIAEATKNGTLKWEDVQSAYNTIGEDKDAISEGIKQMTEKFKQVGDNPIAYMKSIVAIAGSGGLDLAKSHLIAAPLARMFVSQQFGGKDHADENLRNLGVVGGLDGMNFNMSSMFTTDHPDDICLVVFYELELFQLFGRDVLKLQFSKQACTGGWLGGDNVQAFVDPSKDAPADGESGEAAPDGEGNTGENTPDEETTPESTPATTDVPEQEAPVDTSDSIWHMKTEYDDEMTRDIEFGSIFRKNDVEFAKEHGFYYYEVDDKGESNGIAYTYSHTTDADSLKISYDTIFQHVQADINNDTEHAYTPETIYKLNYVIYVPENISAEETAAIRKKAEEERQKFYDWYNDAYNAMYFDSPAALEQARASLDAQYEIVTVEIDIQPAGGNYDYSSGGAQ